MRPVVLALLLLSAAAPLAGCITPPEWREGAEREASDQGSSPPPAAATPPREPRTLVVEGTAGGTRDETKKLDVPAGTARISVDALWTVGGTAYFALYDGQGNVVKDSRVSGGATYGPAEWYGADSPREGTWQLTVKISGGGSYRFEITY